MVTSSIPVKNSLYGIRCALKGLVFLQTPGIRRYIWIPILVNLLFYSLAFWLAGNYFGQFVDWLIPSWLDWLRWLLWPLFGISFFLISIFSFTLVANLIASPFYGRLAYKTETLVLGLKPNSTEISWQRAVTSGLSSEIRRIAYFGSRALPLLLLFLIPGVNLFAPFIWLLFSAWFLALEYMSYPMEEHQILFADQRKTLKKRRLGVLAFGCVVAMGLAVPLLNIFVPPAAVIGATIYISGNNR